MKTDLDEGDPKFPFFDECIAHVRLPATWADEHAAATASLAFECNFVLVDGRRTSCMPRRGPLKQTISDACTCASGPTIAEAPNLASLKGCPPAGATSWSEPNFVLHDAPRQDVPTFGQGQSLFQSMQFARDAFADFARFRRFLLARRSHSLACSKKPQPCFTSGMTFFDVVEGTVKGMPSEMGLA